jgi:hypothetical protein
MGEADDEYMLHGDEFLDDVYPEGEDGITACCPYCGAGLEYVTSEEHYGRDYGTQILRCERYPACDAYVGCHKHDGRPKGTVANKELRDWRIRAHKVFDIQWQFCRDKRKGRGRAYTWMQRVMGLGQDEAHIGLFTIEQCKLLVTKCGHDVPDTKSPFQFHE